MQVIARTENTTVYCNTAASFPEGVLKAHEILHQIYPSAEGRQYFGLSWPDRGNILYKAAVSLAPGEKPVTDKFEQFEIRKGLFLSTTIHDFMKHLAAVPQTFQQLISDQRVDATGYCLEEYPDETTMICMVPLDDQKVQDLHRKDLVKVFTALYDEIIDTIQSFSPSQYNTVPSIGGWTPGQLVDHIIKATGGLPDEQTTEPGRLYSEKDEQTRSVFLNYEIKMQAPEFLHPDQEKYSQEEQIAALQNIRDGHLQVIRDKDLLQLCLDFELPVWGTLTRYEWFRFISYHATRHLHQLKNIHNVMN